MCAVLKHLIPPQGVPGVTPNVQAGYCSPVWDSRTVSQVKMLDTGSPLLGKTTPKVSQGHHPLQHCLGFESGWVFWEL